MTYLMIKDRLTKKSIVVEKWNENIIIPRVGELVAWKEVERIPAPKVVSVGYFYSRVSASDANVNVLVEVE